MVIKRIFLSLLAFIMVFAFIAADKVQCFADGAVPVAENAEFGTVINTSLKAQLTAHDPENDIVSYMLITKPVKGSIELEQDGSFVYTPEQGKKGRDYFGYKVIDSCGNLSQEGTVIIRINKS